MTPREEFDAARRDLVSAQIAFATAKRGESVNSLDRLTAAQLRYEAAAAQLESLMNDEESSAGSAPEITESQRCPSCGSPLIEFQGVQSDPIDGEISTYLCKGCGVGWGETDDEDDDFDVDAYSAGEYADMDFSEDESDTKPIEGLSDHVES